MTRIAEEVKAMYTISKKEAIAILKNLKCGTGSYPVLKLARGAENGNGYVTYMISVDGAEADPSFGVGTIIGANGSNPFDSVKSQFPQILCKSAVKRFVEAIKSMDEMIGINVSKDGINNYVIELYSNVATHSAIPAFRIPCVNSEQSEYENSRFSTMPECIFGKARTIENLPEYIPLKTIAAIMGADVRMDGMGKRQLIAMEEGEMYAIVSRCMMTFPINNVKEPKTLITLDANHKFGKQDTIKLINGVPMAQVATSAWKTIPTGGTPFIPLDNARCAIPRADALTNGVTFEIKDLKRIMKEISVWLDMTYFKKDCPVTMRQTNDGLVEFNVCVDKRDDHKGKEGSGFGMTDKIPYITSLNLRGAKKDTPAGLEGWQIKLVVTLAEEMGAKIVDWYWSEQDDVPQTLAEFWIDEFDEPVRVIMMQMII